MAASDQIFAAIDAGDDEGVRELVDRRPELASARDPAGLSAVLRAAYAGKEELVQVLLEANPALDVFDAAAVGRTMG